MFSTIKKLKGHIRKMHKDHCYICIMCEVVCYKVESSLKKHIAKEHPDPELETTESSQHILNLSTLSAGSAIERQPVKRSSSATGQLCSKKQKMSEHSAEYKCDQCEKSYNWHKLLIRHNQTHGDRFPCTVCGHTFFTSG